MKKSAKRSNFIQRYRQRLPQMLDGLGLQGQKQTEPATDLTEEHPPVQIDSWDNAHVGSECWNCNDPSSLARRVSLIR